MIDDDLAPYVVALFFIMMGTMTFINPDKGKLQKWLYWVVAPLAVIVICSLAFKSLLGGIGFGIPFIILIYLGYFRYRS